MSSNSDTNNNKVHANIHIPAFQALFDQGAAAGASAVQVIHDGRQLTAESLQKGTLDSSRPIHVKDTPESIGMTVFRGAHGEEVTVRHIADLIGHHWPVRVVDVEHQEELQGWTLGDLVEYFEDEDRLRFCHQQRCDSSKANTTNDNNAPPKRRKRKAAEKARDLFMREKPRTLNQISLEFSRTALGPKVKSPKFVRDLDWIGNHWPLELRRDVASYPSVQYYCLTSTKGCWTDFHVDFGGSSVYYHVLSGAKMFVLIKPSPENLAIYEKWLQHPDQDSIFLPDKIANPQDVLMVHLNTAETLFIPTGWIHGVYTPQDAVVLGGNFLHGLDMPIQLETDEIESRTKVLTKFRFPHFRKLHFYTAGAYLKKLRRSQQGLAAKELAGMPSLMEALEKWHGEAANASNSNDQQKGNDVMEAAIYAAKQNGYDSVSNFLQALKKEYEATKNGSNSTPNKKGLSIKLPLSTAAAKRNPLKSPKSPKIRLSLSPAICADLSAQKQKDHDDDKHDDTFRIVISSVAKEQHQPLPKIKRNPRLREDVEYVDTPADDDDWEPAPSSRRRKSAGGNSNNNKRRGSNAPSCPATHNHLSGGVGSPRTSSKKAKTTARQRLLKKFR